MAEMMAAERPEEMIIIDMDSPMKFLRPHAGSKRPPPPLPLPEGHRCFQDVVLDTKECMRNMVHLFEELVLQHELEVAHPQGAVAGGNASSNRRVGSKGSTSDHGQGYHVSYPSGDGGVSIADTSRTPKDDISEAGDDEDSPLARIARDQRLRMSRPTSLRSMSNKDLDTISVRDLRESRTGVSNRGMFSIKDSVVDYDSLGRLQSRRPLLQTQDGYYEIWDQKELSSLTTENGASMLSERALVATRFFTKASFLHSDSAIVTMLETLGLICLVWDCFALPWFLALYEDTDTVFWSCSLVPRFFWLLDLVLKFFMSHDYQPLSSTTAETSFGIAQAPSHSESLKRVAVMYVKRWFGFDFTMVVLDWVFVWLSRNRPSRSNVGIYVYDLMLIAFALRVVRQAWRLGVVREKFRAWMCRHPTIAVLADMSIVLLPLALLTHLIACMFLLVGEASSDTGDTWLRVWREERAAENKMRISRLYAYCTALHWTWTQVTPGSMEVVPQSSGERLYTVVVLMMGVIVGPMLTAAIVSMMSEQKMRFEDRSRRFTQLQQYFVQENVDVRMQIAIKRQVKERLSERHRIRLTEVNLVNLLPRSLRDDLCYFVYAKVLLEHVFFRVLDIFDNAAVVSICSQTIYPIEKVSGEVLFEPGQDGESMYFVKSGSLIYNPGAAVSEQSQVFLMSDNMGITAGDWCSEAALWVKWKHMGTMKAHTTTDLLQIGAKALQKGLLRHPDAFAVTCEFARAFTDYYIGDSVSWSDLGRGASIDHDDIFSGFKHGLRMALAEPILNWMQWDRKDFNFFRNMFEVQTKFRKLTEEISSGTCFISIHSHGEVVRTVSVVALRARRMEDPMKFLVQIAELKQKNGEDALKVACLLPGTKRQEQEAASVAIKRLVHDQLPPFAERLPLDRWQQVDHEVYFKDSDTYGIRTRYKRTTFDLEIDKAEHMLRTIDTPGESFTVPTAHHHRHVHEGSKKGPFCCGCRRSARRVLHREHIDDSAILHRSSSPKARTEEVASEVLQGKNHALVSRAVGGNVTAYLWLSEEEMDILCQEQAKPVLRAFVEELDMDCFEEPAADDFEHLNL